MQFGRYKCNTKYKNLETKNFSHDYLRLSSEIFWLLLSKYICHVKLIIENCICSIKKIEQTIKKINFGALN